MLQLTSMKFQQHKKIQEIFKATKFKDCANFSQCWQNKIFF